MKRTVVLKHIATLGQAQKPIQTLRSANIRQGIKARAE